MVFRYQIFLNNYKHIYSIYKENVTGGRIINSVTFPTTLQYILIIVTLYCFIVFPHINFVKYQLCRIYPKKLSPKPCLATAVYSPLLWWWILTSSTTTMKRCKNRILIEKPKMPLQVSLWFPLCVREWDIASICCDLLYFRRRTLHS